MRKSRKRMFLNNYKYLFVCLSRLSETSTSRNSDQIFWIWSKRYTVERWQLVANYTWDFYGLTVFFLYSKFILFCEWGFFLSCRWNSFQGTCFWMEKYLHRMKQRMRDKIRRVNLFQSYLIWIMWWWNFNEIQLDWFELRNQL